MKYCSLLSGFGVNSSLWPRGAKGAGEAGTVGAMPVVMNAVMDALAPLRLREFDMPATSDQVWAAIEKTRSLSTERNEQ